MQLNPVVDRISIYPVKSLDGISLQKAQIGNGGSLLHDREYAIIDQQGKFVNGKSNARVHLLRSVVDLENEKIALRPEGEVEWNSFHLQNDLPAINKFLSAWFKMPVTLARNTEGEFLDVPVQSGVTVLSNASLQTVSNWFNGMDMEETRKRFRANIEITGAPAFWEDKLFLEEGTAIEFKIGKVTIYGISPRARCVVPTRHPQTGKLIHAFPKIFAKQRMEQLPPWSTLQDYGHAYYLSVDCYIPPTSFGKWIATGDELTIIGKRSFSVLPALV
ncbi:MAG: MOSC domain-containing protein [Ferruginibacter sp.]